MHSEKISDSSIWIRNSSQWKYEFVWFDYIYGRAIWNFYVYRIIWAHWRRKINGRLLGQERVRKRFYFVNVETSKIMYLLTFSRSSTVTKAQNNRFSKHDIKLLNFPMNSSSPILLKLWAKQNLISFYAFWLVLLLWLNKLETTSNIKVCIIY